MTSRIISCPRCHTKCAWEDNPHRPFCSERCRLIDLGNWADESYTIPENSSSTLDNVIPFPRKNPDEEQ